MKKWFLAPLALACAFAGAQTTVTPILQPHETFVDGSGAPCALCSLYTYIAGTTTPQPTYTDSSGTSQNTNPIILDAAGGANIWLGSTYVYKFVLKDATGTTVWSVDNVQGAKGIVPCASSNAVQIANTSTSTLNCDPNITIDPTSHALQVGGGITGPSFTLKNLSTITSSWTFDVTSPATALASFGAIGLPSLATQAADSLVMNATASSASPMAVVLPSGCTNGDNYDTTTHSWTCASTTVPLSHLATQAADTVVGNFTGSTAAPTGTALPTGCAYGVNYSTSSHTWSCIPSYAYNPADHDVSLSRGFGTTYQNTSSGPMRIYGYGSTGGSSVGSVEVRIGASTPTATTYANTCAATVGGGACGFSAEVPAGWFYAIVANTKSGGSSAVSSVGSWHEVY